MKVKSAIGKTIIPLMGAFPVTSYHHHQATDILLSHTNLTPESTKTSQSSKSHKTTRGTSPAMAHVIEDLMWTILELLEQAVK